MQCTLARTGASSATKQLHNRCKAASRLNGGQQRRRLSSSSGKSGSGRQYFTVGAARG